MDRKIKEPIIIKIDTIKSMSVEDRHTTYQHVNRNGYMILEESGHSTPQESLDAICSYFGSAVRHNMSDDLGIHPIEFIDDQASYANTTNGDLSLHTDGSFEDHPPNVMFIYCEKPAEQGGMNRLAIADDIFNHLNSNYPEVLPGLMKENAYTAERDDRKSTHPIFKEKSGWLQMIFRAGRGISISFDDEAKPGVAEIERFLAGNDNSVMIKLQSKQLLIMDNTRVLHGRTAFKRDAGRKLHGLWCEADPAISKYFTPGFQVD